MKYFFPKIYPLPLTLKRARAQKCYLNVFTVFGLYHEKHERRYKNIFTLSIYQNGCEIYKVEFWCTKTSIIIIRYPNHFLTQIICIHSFTYLSKMIFLIHARYHTHKNTNKVPLKLSLHILAGKIKAQ